MRNFLINGIILLLLAIQPYPLPTLSAAARPATAAAVGHHLDLPVTAFTLGNGMRFLVLPRHDVPTVAAYLQFKVGSADEGPGYTGGSHLLEHMMFKGTPDTGTWNHAAEIPILHQIDRLAGQMAAEQAKLATAYGGGDPAKVAALKEQIFRLQEQEKKYTLPEELWRIYQRNGGTGLNASTGEDGTNYYVNLPANRLEVWACLESDRMAHPVFREFYSERDVVSEERRMRTDNDPDGKLFAALQTVAYAGCPYHWSTPGWPSDLQNMRREDVERNFKTWYAPNNAVAALVGDVDAEQVKALADKYFGPIPARPPPVEAPTPRPRWRAPSGASWACSRPGRCRSPRSTRW